MITKLVKQKPGTFFMEVEEKKIPDDMTVNDIIKKYISLDELKPGNYNSICCFLVEKKDGKKRQIKKYHIGEAYPLEKIKAEFGKDSILYRNIKNNNYDCAIKYLAGNFGGVSKKDVVYSREQILDIITQANTEKDEEMQ